MAGIVLRAEVGEIFYEAKAWRRAFNLNLKILQSDQELSLLGHSKINNHKSNSDKLVNNKLMFLGISTELMGRINVDELRNLIGI